MAAFLGPMPTRREKVLHFLAGVCAALLWFVAALISPISLEAQMQDPAQPANPDAAAPAAPVSIIPAPAVMTPGQGTFTLKSNTVIAADEGVKSEAQYLADVLAPATGFQLAVKMGSDKAPKSNAIVLKLDPSLQGLGEEGYALTVGKDRVEARAPKAAGIFYAVQTMRQLLPVEILGARKVTGVAWSIPCLKIDDLPRFAWRGQLLDCGRHFFPKETVKRAIDLLALHKMNRLHWHLTEDQGWRLEIKRYPQLTNKGAWRIEKDGSRYGGFYTQDDVREIVAYAAARHVVVVPEIEMPGHSSAALASYPDFGCTGGPYKVESEWGVFPDVFCAGNDKTFEFLQNVLTEVMDLFPSPSIHIGGDECPKDRWKVCPKCQARIKTESLKNESELQSYFIKRIDAFLTSKNRRLIGWDEILEGGLAPNAVVQSWRGTKGGIEAAKQNHDVVMSPTTHCYLDYSYLTINLEKAYSYEPIPAELNAEQAKHVLGLEGNIWTEHVPDQDRLDFQVYPRLTALAEAAWSPKDKRNWDDFQERLKTQVRRFEILGVKYGFDPLSEILGKSTVVGTWTAGQMRPEGVTLEYELTTIGFLPGIYKVIPLFTEGTAGVEIDSMVLLRNNEEISRDDHLGWSGTDKRDIIYSLELKEQGEAMQYILRVHMKPVGGTDSNGEIRLVPPPMP